MKTLAALALSALTLPAFAASVFDQVTNRPICYGREYSAAELKAHPAQTVAKMETKMRRILPESLISSSKSHYKALITTTPTIAISFFATSARANAPLAAMKVA